MSMEYIRHYYGVPAKRGTKVKIKSPASPSVIFDGVIVGSKNAWLRVRVNGRIMTYHPTDNIEYI